MLNRDVTWGDLRKIHAQAVLDGGYIPDDLLADPEDMARSKEKADDEYYFDLSDEEKAYYKDSAEKWDIENREGTVSVTISDIGEILELIKVVDDLGLFVREQGGWWSVDPEQEEPRIFDQTLADVDESFVEYWDRLKTENAPITKEVIQDYLV